MKQNLVEILQNRPKFTSFEQKKEIFPKIQGSKPYFPTRIIIITVSSGIPHKPECWTYKLVYEHPLIGISSIAVFPSVSVGGPWNFKKLTFWPCENWNFEKS